VDWNEVSTLHHSKPRGLRTKGIQPTTRTAGPTLPPLLPFPNLLLLLLLLTRYSSPVSSKRPTWGNETSELRTFSLPIQYPTLCSCRCHLMLLVYLAKAIFVLIVWRKRRLIESQTADPKELSKSHRTIEPHHPQTVTAATPSDTPRSPPVRTLS